MNKWVGMGRLCTDPEIRYTQGANSISVARYRLAVDRRRKAEDEQQTDFISCVAFGKAAEFAERYLHKGTRIVVCGTIRTGSYTNRDGQKVYTTDVVIEEQEFAESRAASERGRETATAPAPAPSDGFMDIPEGFEREGLPFS